MKATEKVRQTLLRRDRELTELLSKLASQIAGYRAEQAEIRADMKALGIKPEDSGGMPNASVVQLRVVTQQQPEQDQPLSPPENFTKKAMVRRALSGHFKNGATKQQLIEFFKNEWGKTVHSAALSVALSQMGAASEVVNKNLVWYWAKREGPGE